MRDGAAIMHRPDTSIPPLCSASRWLRRRRRSRARTRAKPASSAALAHNAHRCAGARHRHGGWASLCCGPSASGLFNPLAVPLALSLFLVLAVALPLALDLTGASVEFLLVLAGLIVAAAVTAAAIM